MFQPNKISKKEPIDRTKTETIEESIRLRRMRCIGNVLRKGTVEDQKVALTWTPEGRRTRGRKRETWLWIAERKGFVWTAKLKGSRGRCQRQLERYVSCLMLYKEQRG